MSGEFEPTKRQSERMTVAQLRELTKLKEETNGRS